MICWCSRSHWVYSQESLSIVDRVGSSRAIADVLLRLLRRFLMMVVVLVLRSPAMVVVHEDRRR